MALSVGYGTRASPWFVTFVQTTTKLLIAHCRVSAGAPTRPVILFGIVRNLSGICQEVKILLPLFHRWPCSRATFQPQLRKTLTLWLLFLKTSGGSFIPALPMYLEWGGGYCPCSRGCFSLLPGSLGDDQEKMDLNSLDLCKNELDEVVSQPLPMSGEPLFKGVSANASGEVLAGAALLSPGETSPLVKNLKAVFWCLPNQRSSGDPPPWVYCPLTPSCVAASSVCMHSLSFPVPFQWREVPPLVRPPLIGLVVRVSCPGPLGPVDRQSLSWTTTISYFLFFKTSITFFPFSTLLMALSVISVNVNRLRDDHLRLGFLQWLSHLSP